MDRSSEILGTVAKIKKETQDEDINEFAETAMNELLGWYGYGTSREDSKMPLSCHSHPGSNSSDPESPKYADGCEWCGKPVDESKGLSSSGATFCSELCFSQSRRANFKKNKTCDWCRHVRHTVSYVDFQDGASQLQFCSDKCLNQYKMHIFCRETRAHLEMHPHLPDDHVSAGGLITPDLWLRNCKSPEPSSSSPPISPKMIEKPQTSPLPLITVAHPSKFMAKHDQDSSKRQRTKLQKRQRKRCPATVTCSPTVSSPPISEIPQDLRVRHTPPSNSFESIKFRDEQRPNAYGRNFADHFQRPLFDIPNSFPGPRFMPPMFNTPLPSQPPSSGSLIPPVTVLVPYPIIIPLPLPIPIPIPISTEGKVKLDEIISNEGKNNIPSQNGSSATNTKRDNEPNQTGENENLRENEKVKQDVTKENSIDVVNGIASPVRKRKRTVVEPKVKIVSVKNKNSVPV